MDHEQAMRSIKRSSLAARALHDEITALRDDIHQLGAALADIDVTLALLWQELHRTNRARLPQPLRLPRPTAAE